MSTAKITVKVIQKLKLFCAVGSLFVSLLKTAKKSDTIVKMYTAHIRMFIFVCRMMQLWIKHEIFAAATV